MLTFWLIIIRHSPVPVERDADLAFLRRFEFLAVQFDGIRMSIDDTVADAAVIHIQVRSTELRARSGGEISIKKHLHPGFSRRVAFRRALAVTRPARSKNTTTIA